MINVAIEMTTPLTPEEQELERKRVELSDLEEELAGRELELETLRGQLTRFHAEFLRTVGLKYAELDELETEIAALLAAQSTGRVPDERAHVAAQAFAARAHTNGSATQVAAEPPGDDTATFDASSDLKQLYREVAKTVHPDLAIDEGERALRQEFMARANRAYAACSLEDLKNVLAEWLMDPHTVPGNGTGATLVRVIRQIAQVKRRLDEILLEVASLQESNLHQLMTKANAARSRGVNLLANMAAEVESQIEAARSRRDRLREAHP